MHGHIIKIFDLGKQQQQCLFSFTFTDEAEAMK